MILDLTSSSSHPPATTLALAYVGATRVTSESLLAWRGAPLVEDLVVGRGHSVFKARQIFEAKIEDMHREFMGISEDEEVQQHVQDLQRRRPDWGDHDIQDLISILTSKGIPDIAPCVSERIASNKSKSKSGVMNVSRGRGHQITTGGPSKKAAKKPEKPPPAPSPEAHAKPPHAAPVEEGRIDECVDDEFGPQ